MNKTAIIWIVVAIVVILGGWYWLSMGQTQQPSTAQTSPTTAQPTATAPAATPSTTPTLVFSLKTDPSLGSYLAATNGMTLYIDTKDTAGVSTCTGVCLANWPAYTVSNGAMLTGGAGVSGAIGTVTGSSQLTYKGMPLYFWVRDTKPGDVTGNKVGNFVVAKP
ncbi:MAG: COG4315 family predicted lipoprotein [Minisyncoccota bacterium]